VRHARTIHGFTHAAPSSNDARRGPRPSARSTARLRVSFDFASFGPVLSDGVSFVGLVNGIQTEILADVISSTTDWVTGNPLFGAAITELRLVGASQHDGILRLDNFADANRVPDRARTCVPNAARLGLAGIGARRWRHRKP
jgi:hypothetical protein